MTVDDTGTTAPGGAPARALVAGLWAVLGLGAGAVALSALGVHSEPVPGLTLFFLLAGPGAALAWALPGRELALRLLVAVFGGLALDAVIAQVMLTLRWWSPSGGALAALALTGALLAFGAFGTRRASARTGPPPSPVRPYGGRIAGRNPGPSAAPNARADDRRGSAAP